MYKAWEGFNLGKWSETIDVRDFIQLNIKGYEGDESFLAPATEKTLKIWNTVAPKIDQRNRTNFVDVDTTRFSGITSYPAGYICEEDDVCVGLQTDEPLKVIMNPYGGMAMVENALTEMGLTLDPELKATFLEYRKTHNQGCFDAYTKEMRLARTSGLLTGLPDAYGRGRIIGEYTRVPLYGVDFLIRQKQKDFAALNGAASEDTIRLREEISEQVRALGKMKELANSYGLDISLPATNAKEAVQWLYMAYLAAIKENNGAAMSLGRIDGFIDCYIQRDLENGVITESEAQEIIDNFVIKCRLVCHLRQQAYHEIFGGWPTWVTLSIGGTKENGETLVNKSSFRILHTLDNLGASPEPNLTVFWAQDLPEDWKRYCASMSIKHSSIQYENDDLMRPLFGDTAGIACCVSAMSAGNQMQFFGARCNMGKALLYSMNGGCDELKTEKTSDKPLKVVDGLEFNTEEVLTWETVYPNFKKAVAKLAELYVNTMNTIHYMHDKYAYEASQLAVLDTHLERIMAFGIAGVAMTADSLSAIKHAKVTPIRNAHGIAVDFKVEGEYPKYGNDDDRVDDIAVEIVKHFVDELKKHKTYRNATHSCSILTITSNVMYSKKTGMLPSRRPGEYMAPGANPQHGADSSGALASLNSVAKLPYENYCQDGISNTFNLMPSSLGKGHEERTSNLVQMMNGYFKNGGFHLNVNVFDRELLLKVYNEEDHVVNPVCRISGYAVYFRALSREHQKEIIERTFQDRM